VAKVVRKEKLGPYRSKKDLHFEQAARGNLYPKSNLIMSRFRENLRADNVGDRPGQKPERRVPFSREGGDPPARGGATVLGGDPSL